MNSQGLLRCGRRHPSDGGPLGCGPDRRVPAQPFSGTELPLRPVASQREFRFPDWGRLLRRSVFVLAAAATVACGLAEDERDEKDRYVYLDLSDASFSAYCLAQFDSDGDGQLSRYEARRVLHIDCSGLGIASLDDLSRFENLETLDCSCNALTTLDVSRLPSLQRLDCAENKLQRLEIGALRSLTALRCSQNRLTSLDLGRCTALANLEARANLFPSLDLRNCAAGLQADLCDNASLHTLYCLLSQDVWADGHTDVVRD